MRHNKSGFDDEVVCVHLYCAAKLYIKIIFFVAGNMELSIFLVRYYLFNLNILP